MTFLSLSGMLSLPWSPLSSRPPELDVPLPLGLLRAAPVVGAVPGVAELAAGSPVTDPRPLGAPFSAKAADAPVRRTATAVSNVFIGILQFVAQAAQLAGVPPDRRGAQKCFLMALEPIWNRGVGAGLVAWFRRTK